MVKQENLGNLGEIPKEVPEQIEMDRQLKEMAVNLGREEKVSSRRSFLKDVFKTTATVAVGASVLENVSEAAAQDSGTAESKETQKKNVAFLKDIFQKLSEGGIGKAENGNLILHVGDGHYFGLENSDLSKLVDGVGTHREYLERLRNNYSNASESEKSKYQQVIEKAELVAKSSVKNGIIKANHPVESENLPPRLKEFEEKRLEIKKEKAKAVREMNEGSIIQPY